jgi:hypothetical protein
MFVSKKSIFFGDISENSFCTEMVFIGDPSFIFDISIEEDPTKLFSISFRVS